MKKIIIICLVGILLSTAFGAAALSNTGETKEVPDQESRLATHNVLGEYGTATWCGYCQYAHGALKEIWAEGQYPFFYVTLVTDKNTKASQRCLNDYNAYGWPTVWFDGGFKVNVGAGSIPSAKAAYISSITQSGNRAVEDVDIDLTCSWLGGTNMEINVEVFNNEAETYGGRIRVYITEKESSMGWYDTAGRKYTMAFLDYAFNQALSIPAGDSWSGSMQWDGAAMGFPSVTENNMMIIAAVFNDEVHQGYSYPPSSNPFNAYYVDESVGFSFGSGPNTPSNPNPTNGATNVDINKDLSWTGGPGTAITYDVYFGTTSSPPKVQSNKTGTTYDPGTLAYSTKYYWKIVAWDQDDNSAAGPVWSFTTTTDPNEAPDTPTITGPAKGKPGSTYKYTITGTDPDPGDELYAYVMWGDGTFTDWVGPYDSGEAFSVTHSWVETGTYTVQVKVKDNHGAESDWGTLDVKMPTSYGITNPFLTWLLQTFPHAFPLLRYLLGI